MIEEPDIPRRVDMLERDVRDHSKSITAMIEEVRVISQWQRAQDLIMAREDERDKALDNRLRGIETELHSIKGGFSKAQWIIIGAVILAIVGWVLSGGLKP